MEVHFTPELEAMLADQAARQGRDAGELVKDAVSRYVEQESHFIAAVMDGEEALANGDVLTHEQVGQSLYRFLRD